MSGNFDTFLRIREEYARVLPEWMEDYKATGQTEQDPYFMDWLRMFTPIESAVWSDIRSAGIPFYPQFPALNYFIDFACPMLKIGIECDGKAWHDSERDKVRDGHLANDGWVIFRIEGHECKRILPESWSECDEVPYENVERWFMTTSEGVIHAIKAEYFVDRLGKFDEKHRSLIMSTLFEHKSTPYNFVPPRRPRTPTKPKLFRESLDEYMATLKRRMNYGK